MNQREIRRLAELLREYSLTEIEIEREGVRVRLRRETGGSASAPSAVTGPAPRLQGEVGASALPGASAASQAHLLTIEAPMVGTFYRAPSPDAQPFVREGDRVKKGQVVCIVEAMKLMNEIEAESEGKIEEILVQNGEHVEYGQHLFRLGK